MRCVVMGASGGCGRELVRQAAAAGHDVVALGRESSHLPPTDGVTVARGAIDDVAFLTRSFEGSDVVLSAVGLKLPGLAPWAVPEDPSLLSRATPIWIEAMRAASVPRILAISAAGVGTSSERVPAAFRWLIRGTSLRHAYPELEVMETYLVRSGLEVCCVRPTGLHDGPRTGHAVVAERIRGAARIARADVAAWMLAEAVAPSLRNATPMITVTGAG